MNAAPDLHTLTGAYAAHALPEAEQLAFERHLAQCPACAQEVAEFRATLARLGTAESVLPSPELKQRVLAGLGEIRQLPPAAGPTTPAGRWSRLRRRWPNLALAACLALAAGSGALAVEQHDQAQQARAEATRLHDQQAAIGALLTAPDARTATAAAPASGGAGTVVWSQGRGQAAFLATGMPSPPQGHTYELWFNDAGTMRPAGLLPGGTGQLLLTGAIDGAVGVGVTVEPSGGSAHPTGQPVMLLAFS
ncbi:anti-sigma factor [Kitasatospora viridis]|uniref:Regulator of SigK n=1 Tax=Kitasatospora viridis TaxID=281105 RepID=A0A561TT15_9ACTN|nr:anti-sigma factor [Kitasatospora viridis]TWF90256.1 anti-sigma-K factor RskA [Kitasatospora viridis]